MSGRTGPRGMVSRTGRPIGVVGPSGAGKDTLIEALCAARPDILARARRVITRDPAVNDEDACCVDEAAFEARRRAGAFAVHWSAHGLRYGIEAARLAPLARGCDVILSLSRGVLDHLAAMPGAEALWVTARPEVLARRLAARGREDDATIARRLHRADTPGPDRPPAGLIVHRIDNSGAIADTLAAALAALYPDSATVSTA